ncbi:transposase [Paenibacillus albidus]|nr:transposase [Paenibacillus albidus]
MVAATATIPKCLPISLLYAYTQRIYSSRKIAKSETSLHVAGGTAAPGFPHAQPLSFSADEGRPLAKWSAQTRIQCTYRDQKPVYFDLQSTPKTYRYPLFQPHIERTRQILGKLPQTVIADAGYGSEENYAYFENEHMKAVVK